MTYLSRCICLALLSTATLAIAQENVSPAVSNVLPKPLPAASGQPNPLTLHVAVTDSSGRPLNNLVQSDFVILDAGQPANVVGFRAPGAGIESPEIVLLLDTVNQSYKRLPFVRDQMAKYLQSNGGRLSQPVIVAMLTDGGIETIAGPSTDGNAMATTLTGKSSPLRAITRSSGIYGAQDRLEKSINAVSNLALSAAEKPGHRLLIWMSPGWPLLNVPSQSYTTRDQQKLFDAIVSLNTRFQLADITLYSVNTEGSGTGANLYNTQYQSFLKPVEKPRQTQFANLGLQVLAIHSGGLAILPSNDLTTGILQCAADAGNTYTILLKTATGAEVPTFHKLEVRVARSGIKTRTASGFYALPPTPAGQ